MSRNSLRTRITLTLFLFVSVTSGLFALTIFGVNERLESQLLDETLENEFDSFQQRYQMGRQLPLPYSTLMRSWLIDAQGTQSLPQALWSLGPGTHHEIEIEGRPYHVLNRAIGDKRVYIAHDITRIERREDQLATFLITGVLTASLLSLWAGFLLSRGLIAQVSRLAARVSQFEPGQRSASLEQEFTQSEVSVIARAFDRFLLRLEDFIARERAFSEDASHELRTPLAVIDGASELLLAEQEQPEFRRQPLLRIRRASHQMSRQISALLFLARESTESADRPHNCFAETVLSDTVATFRPLLIGRPVELQLDAPEQTELPVPPEYLEIVVANLLQNALAHIREGHVQVTLRDRVLTIEDTGDGISAVDLPRIFERHYRGADSRGLGRGLDLVRRICERYGWRIEVSSRPGQGSRFSLHL